MPVTALRSGLDARHDFQAVHYIGLAGRAFFFPSLLAAAPRIGGGAR
ncbi:hypothetical protein PPMP20_08030 [Paraburkholderia phymatum]|nr:hypothetical protein [Paraburkholderia phymatum]